jgi:hypothetical protein
MNSETSIAEALERRIEKVERENRRLKIAALIAVLCLGGALSLGAAANPPQQQKLEAETIVLRDAEGKTRIVLGVDKEGPGIAFLDAKGKLRMNLGLAKEGPALDLLDAAEQPRATLLLTEDQGPILNFVDKKGSQVTLKP